MREHLTLEAVEADGADGEAYESLPRSTRMGLLQRGLLAGGRLRSVAS